MSVAKVRRVGVLTRHCYPNYGSLLQAYALSKAFEDVGADTVVMDYIPKDDTPLRLASASLRDSRMQVGHVKRWIYRLVQAPNFAIMALVFRIFQQRNLRLTPRTSTLTDRSMLWDRIDTAVVGSDQIWARIHGRLDETYFLSSAPGRLSRFSYAASLGSALPMPADQATVVELAKGLDTVSLREASAIDFMRSAGVGARFDVDPVLLHGRQFWSTFARQRRRRPYILVYQLHNTPRFTSILRAVASHYGLPIMRVGVDYKQFLRPGRFHYLCSPQEFVGLFMGASAVVTDSFHGSIFSLIFGVPLYAIAPDAHSTRLHDLLTSVNLQRLEVNQEMTSPSFFQLHEYDTEEIAQRLAALREPSWNYLREIVEE